MNAQFLTDNRTNFRHILQCILSSLNCPFLFSEYTGFLGITMSSRINDVEALLDLLETDFPSSRANPECHVNLRDLPGLYANQPRGSTSTSTRQQQRRARGRSINPVPSNRDIADSIRPFLIPEDPKDSKVPSQASENNLSDEENPRIEKDEETSQRNEGEAYQDDRSDIPGVHLPRPESLYETGSMSFE